MARFGFVGPSYSGQNPSASADRLQNWYVEALETGMGASPFQLCPTPGLKVFSTPNAAEGSATVQSVQVSRQGATSAAISSVQVTNSAQATAGSGVDGGGGAPWTNPGNVTSSSNYASCVFSKSGISNALNATIFGFNIDSAPGGITVSFNAYGADAFTDYMVAQLIYGGNPIGNPVTIGISSTSQAYSLGGDLWGAYLTAAMVNDPSFGVQLIAGSRLYGDTVYVNDVQIAVTQTQFYAILALNSAPFTVGEQIIPENLVGASFLNGFTLTISAVNGNNIAALYPGEVYGPTADTGTAYNVVPSYLSAVLDSMPFSNNETVTFTGLTQATWLNGQSVTIASIVSDTITAPISHADYALTPDTGTVIPGAVTDLPKGRGHYAVNNNRDFTVVDTTLWEIASDGTFTNRGTVANDGLPASMVASATQLLVASGGLLYVLTLATNAFATVPNDSTATPLPAMSQVEYCDGFFIALQANSQQFFVSKALDCTYWDPTQTTIVSVFPDNVLGMKASYRQIWLWGSKKSVVYYDSGNVFPFDVVPGSFVDQGTCAANSPVRLDNSVMWIGQDDRGARMAWRASGYTPTRISNHAVEWNWQQYATASDAISYGFQLNGHSFWHIYFPTANASWRYDCATGMWAEVTSLFNGMFGAHLSQNHVWCFDKHLVGDWSSGNIYEMSDSFYDDAGQPIQRMRRAPHVSTEMTWTFHQMMQVHLETGVVPQPLYDGNGNPRDPQIMLRWSDDGGHTWSNEHWEGAGFGGEYKKRVYWYRLGRSRDRIYEIVVTDPIAWRIVDSFLRAVNSEGKEVMAPQQRFNKRLAEMA